MKTGLCRGLPLRPVSILFTVWVLVFWALVLSDGVLASEIPLTKMENFKRAAHRAMESRDLPIAISILTEGIRRWPNDVEFYYLRAKAHQYSGKGHEMDAIRDYTEVIRRNPKRYPKSYIHRAELFYGLGEYAYALKDATNCLKYIPGYDKVYWMRGQCYAKLGRYDLARAEFARLIKISPKHKEAVVNFLKSINQPS